MTRPESTEIKVLANAFERALDDLGIDYRRFQGASQLSRKEALLQALNRMPSELLKNLNYFTDCSSLDGKTVEDFSEDQLHNHQQMVSLLIALVCLGDTQYLKSLTTYLSFPEIRWSIKILPILEIFSGKQSEPVYRLPNEQEISEWRIWAMELPQKPNQRVYELSKELLDYLGFETQIEQIVAGSIIDSNVFLDVLFPFKHDYFVRRRQKTHDLACKAVLKQSLSQEDTTSLIIHLNHYNDQRFISYENRKQIAFCMRDFLARDSSEYLKNSIKQLYSVMHENPDDIDARTLSTLYLVFADPITPGINRRLAIDFATKLLGKGEQNDFEVCVLADLISGSIEDNSISRIAKAYARDDIFSNKLRKRLAEMKTDSLWLIIQWVSTSIVDELQSICLIGSEHKSHRTKLISRFLEDYHKNSCIFLELESLKFTKQEKEWVRLASFLHDIGNMRNKCMTSTVTIDNINTDELVSQYENFFKSWSFNQKDIENRKQKTHRLIGK